MIKNKFFQVNPLVIGSQPKLVTMGVCFLKYISVLLKSQAFGFWV